MSSSIITVCTHVYTHGIHNIYTHTQFTYTRIHAPGLRTDQLHAHTYTQIHTTYTSAQKATSLTDHLRHNQGGNEDKRQGRMAGEEVNVTSLAGDNDTSSRTQDKKKEQNDKKKTKADINYMLWCKQFFECRVATSNVSL